MKKYVRWWIAPCISILTACGGGSAENPESGPALNVATAGPNVEVVALDDDLFTLSVRSTGPVAAAASVPRNKTALAARADSTTVDVSRTMVTPSTSAPLASGLMAGGTRITGLLPTRPELQPITMAWVARLSANGAVDATFAGGGFTFLPQGHERAETTAVVVDSAGRALVAVAARSTQRPAVGTLYVLRLNSDGILDDSFGSGGVVTIGEHGPASRIRALSVQSSGRILVLGFTAGPLAADRVLFLTALKTDGNLDTGFGTSGRVGLSVGAARPDPIGLELMNDGKIVVAVNGITAATGSVSAGFDAYVARVSGTGVIDNSFGSAGIARIRVPSAQARAVAVGVRGDGSVVLAGQASLPAAGIPDVFFAKLTSSGTLDSTFGTAGIARISAASPELEVRGAVLPPTGTLAAVAHTQETDGPRVAIFAVTAAGQPDTTIAPGGKKLLDAAQFTGRRVISATPSASRRSVTLNTANLQPTAGAFPAPEFVTVANVTREDNTPPPPPCGTFVALGASQGLEVRGGKPGAADWEWGLGYNTQSAGKFVSGQQTWSSGQKVSYTLTFNPDGSASVSYGGSLLNYSAAKAGGIPLGNAVKFYLKASGTNPASSIEATVTRLNNFNLTTSLQTIPTATAFNDKTALIFTKNKFSTGLKIDGSIKLNYIGTVPSGSRLNLIVQPGNYTACN
jgi:uncharacterized delta-60 repeat protein